MLAGFTVEYKKISIAVCMQQKLPRFAAEDCVR